MSGRWNRFGQLCSFPIVLWSTAGLIRAYCHDWPVAAVFGIAAWVAFIAQYQWGRR